MTAIKRPSKANVVRLSQLDQIEVTVSATVGGERRIYRCRPIDTRRSAGRRSGVAHISLSALRRIGELEQGRHERNTAYSTQPA